jgi:hypothetical protein
MIIKQLSVFLEDKSGSLTDLTNILAKNNINLTALSMAESTDYGIVRMVVGNPDLAVKVLKAEGFSVNLTDVVCMKVPNKPGGLYHVLQILSDNDININYMYAFSTEEGALTVLRSESVEKTIKILSENKVKLYDTGDIYQLD